MPSRTPLIQLLHRMVLVIGALAVGALLICASLIPSRQGLAPIVPTDSRPSSNSSILSQSNTDAAKAIVKKHPLIPSDLLEAGSLSELSMVLREMLANVPPDEILEILRLVGETRPTVAIQLAMTIGRSEEEQWNWCADVTQNWTKQNPTAVWQWYL